MKSLTCGLLASAAFALLATPALALGKSTRGTV